MGESNAPLLLISHGKWQKHLIYNVSDNQLHSLKIPLLRNKKVLSYSCGWLVLVEPETNQCSLLNPISMKVIQLPTLEKPYYENTCILTKSPTEPDCHILFNGFFEQSFCQIGDQNYKTKPYYDQEKDECHFLIAMRSFQGQIYGYITPAHQFVSIHFVGNALEFRPIELKMDEDVSRPWLVPCPSLSQEMWLIESCASGGEIELLMVQKTKLTVDLDNAAEFRVFRVDMHKKSCIELANIGQRTIFVNHLGSGYCCPSVGIKSNSIYYTNKGNDRNFHIFDLEDRSTTSLPMPSHFGANSFNSWIDDITLFH